MQPVVSDEAIEAAAELLGIDNTSRRGYGAVKSALTAALAVSGHGECVEAARDAMEQAMACILGDQAEDCSDEIARADTLHKLRAALAKLDGAKE